MTIAAAPDGRKLLRIEARNAQTPIERKPPWIKVKAKLGPQGVDIVTTSPQAMAQLIREDYARWGKIIKAAGIKGD